MAKAPYIRFVYSRILNTAIGAFFILLFFLLNTIPTQIIYIMFPTNNSASTQQLPKPNKFPTNCQQTKQNKFIAKRFHCPNNLHKRIISLPKPNKFPTKDFYITKCISFKDFLHPKKWSISIMVLDQLISSKHHGT